MPNNYGLNKSKHFRQSYYTDCLMGDDPTGYIITADKEGDKWIVYCEEHEPSDLEALYPDNYPVGGFKTLQDAATFIWEFVDDYYKLWEENNNNQADSEDQSTVDTIEHVIINNYYASSDCDCPYRLQRLGVKVGQEIVGPIASHRVRDTTKEREHWENQTRYAYAHACVLPSKKLIKQGMYYYIQ